jgi:putative IMPACT (imprinted ancient) family translation regulator
LNLTNILVVVVRYFGGTKLGVPGLINAYKTSTRMALEQAKIIRKFPTETFEIVFPWSEMNHVMSYVKNENIEVISKEFTEDCNMIIKVPLHKKDELKIYFSSSSVQMNTSTND